jgi:hypothetical protein
MLQALFSVLSIVWLLVSEEVMLCDRGGSKGNLWGSVSDVQSMQPRQSVDFFHLMLALNLHSFGSIRRCPTLRVPFYSFFFSPPLSLFKFFFRSCSFPSDSYDCCDQSVAGAAMGKSKFMRIRGGSNSNSVVDRVNASVQPADRTHQLAVGSACMPELASMVDWRAALLNIY